jgi:hypothetical protein
MSPINKEKGLTASYPGPFPETNPVAIGIDTHTSARKVHPQEARARAPASLRALLARLRYG